MLSETLLRIVDVAESTNDEMGASLRQGIGDGAALVARNQRAGRGRRGHGWTHATGSLAMSVALRGDVMRQHLLRLPLAVAVACAEGIEELYPALRVGLKWPNDLQIGERKLGGILCEAIFRGTTFMGVVVGVGINLRAPAQGWPEDLAQRATSVEETLGVVPPLEPSARRLRAGIVAARDELLTSPQSLLDRWRDRDVLRGQPVRARTGPDELLGEAEGIDASGALLLRAKGEVHRLTSGEVMQVRAQRGGGP